jgi:hypothetical protein
MTARIPGGRKALHARFFKADLQMQTPVDRRHWVGEVSVLPGSPTDEDFQAAATAYVDRCYDVGLEIIGLTDHNLGGEYAEQFYNAFMSAIDDKAVREKWKPKVFLGFEVQANVGKGLHLLCLFDPGTAFAQVDDALTELGLARGSRFESSQAKPLPVEQTLDSILNSVQEKYGGIVIAAHPDGPKGVLSDDDLDDWLQASVIANPGLLCMELRRGREAYASSQSKLGMIVRNDPGEWHRPHPIAVVSSSDCKRLSEEDGGGDEGWIGRRFTWLKMSERTIEGLRQAFLDHDSRIAFGMPSPDQTADHPRIERIQIEGVDFLVDLDVWMSPNLTTLIGGGGTGKSTILEYCRAALQQTISDPTSAVAKNHEGIAGTVGQGRAVLTLSHGSSRMTATVSADGASAADDAGDSIPQLAIRFPAIVLGQREVYEIAGNQSAIGSFVDRLEADRLRSLKHDEDQQRTKAAELGELLDAAAEHEARLAEIRGERDRLLAEVGLVTPTHDGGRSPDAILRDIATVRRIDEALRNRAARIAELADEIAVPLGSGDPASGSGHGTQIRAYADGASGQLAESAERLRSAAEALVRYRELERDVPRDLQIPASWHSNENGGEAGGSLGAIAALLSQLEEYDRQTDRLRAEVARLRADASGRSDCLVELHQVWDEQIAVRNGIAVNLRDLVPETQTGDPFVEVSVVPFGNRLDLEEAVGEHIDDNRRFSSSDVADLVEAAYEAAPDGTNPTLLLCNWLRSLPGDVPVEMEIFSSARIAALSESIGTAAIRQLETARPSDSISVMLRRGDGTVAGTLDSGLSVGQKCTAILALALAEGTFPILIDQPEDEIDNEFIYRNLVPLLRRAKRQRQVILATHDPNLPVNADAELIVALEAKSETGESAFGMLKTLPEGRCVGSLDRPAVKLAVEEIMEGSEEAFLRRHTRYGF